MKVICLMLAAATLNPGGVWGEEASKPDLGSPKSAVLAFKAAVLRRDWVTAEKCLATDVRKILTDAIADRTFFDQYVVNGFTAKTLGFLPANLVTQEGLAQLERLARPAELGGPPGPLPRRYVVTIAQGGGACPWIARCVLVNEGDGWKLSTEPQLAKKEDFLNWYEEAISKDCRGQAKLLEGKPGEPVAGPPLKSEGPAPKAPVGFPGKRAPR